MTTPEQSPRERHSDVPGLGCLLSPFGCLVDGFFAVFIELPLAAGLTYLLATFVFHKPLDSPFVATLLFVNWVLVGVVGGVLLTAVARRWDDDKDAHG